MANRILRISFSALAASALVTFGPPAWAGYFGDSFDPPIPSWAGNATFFVPNPPSPCLSEGPGFVSVNGVEDACQGVALVSLTASFGDATFSFSGNDTTDIYGMILGTGSVALQGIDSHPIGLDCSGACDDASWTVQFSNGAEVTLFEDQTAVALAPSETFTNPEPGSLALVLSALGVGWLAKRRKPAT